MKKTSKKFDKIRAICEKIQAQNEKRNPEHKEPFIFLAKIYKDESEVLHGAIDAEEGDISRMLVLAMENDNLFAKEVIKATRDFQFKQMSKGLKAVSEAFSKLSPKYPSGGIISGTDHGSGKDTEIVMTCSAPISREKNFGDLFEISNNPIRDYLNGKVYYLINCGTFEKKEIENTTELYEIIKKNLTIYKSKQ